MRFLLDEDIDDRLSEILRLLGHDCDHIKSLGQSGATDAEVLAWSASYDVLVTMDLHRQPTEFLAAKRALLDGGVKIARIRARNNVRSDLSFQARCVLCRMDVWTTAIVEGASLVTITDPCSQPRSADVETLRGRLGGAAT